MSTPPLISKLGGLTHKLKWQRAIAATFGEANGALGLL